MKHNYGVEIDALRRNNQRYLGRYQEKIKVPENRTILKGLEDSLDIWFAKGVEYGVNVLSGIVDFPIYNNLPEYVEDSLEATQGRITIQILNNEKIPIR